MDQGNRPTPDGSEQRTPTDRPGVTEASGETFQIDRFDWCISVHPVSPPEERQVSHGGTSRLVRFDNLAEITQTVRFARDNACRLPFHLRYRTRSGEYIAPKEVSANDKVSQLELSRYDDTGREYVCKFTPQKTGLPYSLVLDVYQGFSRGDRSITVPLIETACYRLVRVKLDLTGYLEAGYQLGQAPSLYGDCHYPKCGWPLPHTAKEELTVTSPRPGVWE